MSIWNPNAYVCDANKTVSLPYYNVEIVGIGGKTNTSQANTKQMLYENEWKKYLPEICAIDSIIGEELSSYINSIDGKMYVEVDGLSIEIFNFFRIPYANKKPVNRISKVYCNYIDKYNGTHNVVLKYFKEKR